MALNAYALTTLARTKSFLGISATTNDAVLTSLINVATDLIESFCNRRFLLTTYTQQKNDAYGASCIYLPQYPISSSATFTLEVRNSIQNEGGVSTVASNTYFIRYNDGIIEAANNAKFYDAPLQYLVTYSAGYDFNLTTTFLETVGAADLELACWKLVGSLFGQRANNAAIKSESIGNYSVTYGDQSDVIRGDIKALLMGYRSPKFR